MAPARTSLWVQGAVVLALVRVALVVVYVARQSTTIDGDINRYFAITHDGVPYRDQAVEYPPITVGVLEVIGLVARTRTSFGIGLVIVMALIEMAVCVLMFRGFGRTVGLTFLYLDTPLYYLLITRVDIISVALAAAFIVLLVRGRSLSSGLAWAAAVAAKLWPLPLGVYLVNTALGIRSRARALVAAAGGLLAIGGAWLAVGGVDGVRQVLTFRSSQGWHIESIGGNLVRIFMGGQAYDEANAYRIGRIPNGLGTALLTVGTLAAIAVCIQAMRQRRLGTGWVTAVLCLLATATLFSPQYVIWAIPGAALAIRESRPWLVVSFAITLALTFVESRFYGKVIDGTAAGNGLVLVRNLALVVTLAIGAIALWRTGDRKNHGTAALT